jgi:hypothetical protein
MHDTVALEARGMPTAMVITTEFTLEARTQRDALGMTGLECAVIEHPLSTLTEAQINARIEQAVPQVLAIWQKGGAA